MRCFKREMSAPKRFIDSKAWYPLAFYLKYYHHNGNTSQKHDEELSIRSKNYLKSKTLRELEKFDITLLFIIPRTVLLSSIHPETETLDFSTDALPRNLQKIFPPREHKQR